MKLSKENSRRRWRELRDAVNDWDPIGLIELGAPKDEYECLVGPLMQMLENEKAPTEIGNYLKQYIPNHFGASLPEGIQGFTEEIFKWFQTNWKKTTV
jgi:hypothetical protein